MATQTLEFNCTTGFTVTAEIFAVGSVAVTASVSATEKTNDKGRYRAAFTDVAAGSYRLNAFVSSVGGFANEIYDLTLTTATFYPRSEYDFDSIQDKTDLITSGSISSSLPVATDGTLTEIIIGDDYLAANGRAFEWTVDAPSGFTAATSTCYFGGAYSTHEWLVQGTVTDNGDGTWDLSFDLGRTDTEGLIPSKIYNWSVEVRNALGTEITRVRSGRQVSLVEKYT